MGHNPPAISRPRTCADSDIPVWSTPADTVSHRRGLGDSGYRIEVVEHDCPSCDFDKMIRRTDVHPDMKDSVLYWCLHPNCRHYASDKFSHACHNNYPQRTNHASAEVRQ